MAKVILEFDSFEESQELKIALDGAKWRNVVWQLDQYLHKKIKYTPDTMTDEALKELEKVSSELSEIIHDNKLFFD